MWRGGRAGEGDRLVPYLDYSYSYTNVCTCQNSQNFPLECWILFHISYIWIYKRKKCIYIHLLFYIHILLGGREDSLNFFLSFYQRNKCIWLEIKYYKKVEYKAATPLWPTPVLNAEDFNYFSFLFAMMVNAIALSNTVNAIIYKW